MLGLFFCAPATHRAPTNHHMTTNSKIHPLTIVGSSADATGGLRGYRHNTSYALLVALLGVHHHEDIDGKVHVEWTFQCHNGTTFHVYDWKSATDPRKHPDLPLTWHIGGSSDQALAAFKRFTGLEVAPAF